ncbi:MAG: carboxypeptidase regulatory-like domain-containing protein, partial [Armatimonadia bacterium]
MRITVVVVMLLFLTCNLAAAVTLIGKVVAPDGRTVGDATVWLYRQLQTDTGKESALLATVQTGPDGAFTLQADPKTPLLPGEKWQVYAAAKGSGPALAAVVDEKTPLELKLPALTVLSHKVLTAEGKPVAGATVALESFLGADLARYVSLREEIRTGYRVTTDADGGFTLPIPQGCGRVTFAIRATGYGEVSINVSMTDPLPLIALTPAGRLAARIACPEKPDAAADLKLTLYCSNPVRGESQIYASAAATTDGQGAFAIPEMMPGRWSVGVTDQSERLYQARSAQVVIESGKEATLAIALQKAALVRGKVVAADTGQGLAGATLSLTQERGAEGYYYTSGHTGVDGAFVIPSLPGKARLQVYGAEGYIGTSYQAMPTFDITPAGIDIPDIKLQPAQQVSVVVVDEAGKPVAGANITSKSNDPMDFLARGAGPATGPDGTVVLKGLSAGPRTLAARKGDFASDSVSIEVGKQQLPVRLVLKPRAVAAMTALIVDETGAPFTDARVKVYQEDANYGRDLPCAPPDAEGRVKITGLDVGPKYQFRVSAINCYTLETPAWVGVAGETHDCGTLKLTRHTAFLAGTVVDAAGKPVRGAKVYNTCDAPTPISVLTDEQGAFRLQGLVAGEACAFVQAPGCRFAAVAAPTGTTNMKITPQPLGPVTLGKPVRLRDRTPPPDKGHPMAEAMLVEALRQSANGDVRGELLVALGKINPQAAYDAAGHGKDSLTRLNFEVGMAALPDDFDEGLAQMKQSWDMRYVATGVLKVARSHVNTDPALVRRCLEALEGLNPAIATADWRLLITAQTASLRNELEAGSGDALLRQAGQEALKLGVADWTGYARGVVAENLAAIDLPAALALIEPLTDEYEHTRHLTNAARRVASKDPDKALEVVNNIPESSRGGALAAILAYFPPDRFDRAHKLASGIDTSFQRGLALIRLCRIAPRE